MKPSAATTMVRLAMTRGRPALHVTPRSSDLSPSSAVDLGVGDHRRSSSSPSGDAGARVPGTAPRRCTSVTSGQRLERQRPVHGAVAAADDQHVLAGVLASSRHEVVQAVPSYSSPAGSGRGVNVPMPPVTITAPALTSRPGRWYDEPEPARPWPALELLGPLPEQ